MRPPHYCQVDRVMGEGAHSFLSLDIGHLLPAHSSLSAGYFVATSFSDVFLAAKEGRRASDFAGTVIAPLYSHDTTANQIRPSTPH